MIKPRYDNTERLGVIKTEEIFVRDFNWIFREQPIVDMGIDAHIEIVDEGKPLGILIALQIKTGQSYFYEKENFFTYYINDIHFDYWLNHSLPVILIGFLPEKNIVLWQFINRDFIEKTTKGWKVEISKDKELNLKSKQQIIDLYQTLYLKREIIEFKEDAVTLLKTINPENIKNTISKLRKENYDDAYIFMKLRLEGYPKHIVDHILGEYNRRNPR